ncbi:MAG: hypothetical protein AAF975_05370 [Spirochaetota bacterium]
MTEIEIRAKALEIAATAFAPAIMEHGSPAQLLKSLAESLSVYIKEGLPPDCSGDAQYEAEKALEMYSEEMRMTKRTPSS